MPKILIIFISFFIIVSCTKQNNSSLNRKINLGDSTILIGDEGNYSNVKDCKIEYYSFTKDSIGYSGKLTKTEILKINKGKISEINTFDATAQFEHKYVYAYDSLDSIIKKYKRDGEIVENIIQKMDPKGNILEETRYVSDINDSDGWSYNYLLSENKIIFQKPRNWYSSRIQINGVHYLDGNYNLIETILKFENDRTIQQWKYQYNGKNQLIGKLEFNFLENLNAKLEYVYNEKQRISEIHKTEFFTGAVQDSVLTKIYYTYSDKAIN